MSEKTEQPTPKKLRDARKKGQVAKSKEVSSAALIVVSFGILSAMMATFMEELKELILVPAEFYTTEFGLAASTILGHVIQTSLLIIVPVIGAVAAVGIIANVAQVGMLFSAESIKPKLSKLNPGAGLKKIFDKKNLIEFLKSAAKIAFLSILLFLVIRGEIHDLVKLPHCGIECVPALLGRLLGQVMTYTIAAFVIIAFADYVFQKMPFTKEMMMTMDEVKREFKESEGDPHIKGHRKQLHQELLEGEMDEAVRGSNAVVTNPTHIAVALDYRDGETPLPIVKAMGQNLKARRIVELAREHGIPVMQNVPVARGLFETAQVNQYIPVDMIDTVAEVLRTIREIEAGRR